MQIIDFEEAKVKRDLAKRNRKCTPEKIAEDLELQKQDRELAQFYNRWYDAHVVGQDENGAWIYKDI